MSFNATGTPEPADLIIENHAFFPELDLSDFRTAMRVDNVATEDRAHHALTAGMMETNRRLAEWMQFQQAEGKATLAEVPVSAGQPPNEKTYLYKRAVYALAKASLVERYRDYDTTGNASGRADQLEENLDELRRDAAWAINDLTEKPRSTIELI